MGRMVDFVLRFEKLRYEVLIGTTNTKLFILQPPKKMTKRVLRNIFDFLQSKNSILEVEDETKLFLDSAFGNFLCASAYLT